MFVRMNEFKYMRLCLLRECADDVGFCYFFSGGETQILLGKLLFLLHFL